jgi:beta-glucosidase
MVLIHGRALAIGWEKEHIDAILDGWYLGQETGNALARTIFGDNNPGGKLPVTYMRNVGQLPHYYNVLPTGRARNIYDSDPEPLYPFGYGLSYTTFELSGFKLTADEMTQNDTVYAVVTVKNTGKMQGDEVVQMYVRDMYASYVRPHLELKGFKRITLEPDESKEVRIPVTKKALRFWKEGKWIVEPGDFTVMLGTNSVELHEMKLVVKYHEKNS